MTAANPPLVTVIVGCYNHARFVVEALDSVKNQTFRPFQFIIFDDCSKKDNSVEVIRKWIAESGMDCTFLPHEKNMGICRSLNHAISHATGKYISMLAADDAWLPNKLAEQVPLFESLGEDVAVLFSDAFQMNEHGTLLPEMFLKANAPWSQIPQGNIFPALWETNFIPAMTTLIRTRYIREVGGYDESLAFEDWDMWLQLARRYKFFYSPNPSAKYRILSTSIMRTQSAQIQASVTRLRLKHATKKPLPPPVRHSAAAFVGLHAEHLYKEGSATRHHYFFQSMAMRPRPRLTAMCLFSTLGLPFHYFKRLDRLLWNRGSQAAQ